MAIDRAVVTLPMDSGLPEDAAKNVFHFEKASGAFTAADRLTISGLLQDFYDNANSPGVFAISQFLSPLINPLEVFVEHYDLQPGGPGEADDISGNPVQTDPIPLTGPDPTGVALPTEVSLCLSFRAAYGSAVETIPGGPSGPAGDTKPRARRRGRVYIGPLNTVALGINGRPAANLINALVGGGDLLDGPVGFPAGVEWSVYSRSDGVARNVNDGWVDNEFDTQRRRGREATTRTVFV